MLTPGVCRATVAADVDTIDRASPRRLSTTDGVGRRQLYLPRPAGSIHDRFDTEE